MNIYLFILLTCITSSLFSSNGSSNTLNAPATAAPMIINRTGQSISVMYFDIFQNPLYTTGTITLNGSSDHTADQMVLIPSTSIINPAANPTANYQNSAATAVITVGSTAINIPFFDANTSYVITAGTQAGNYVANPGIAVYNTSTGSATYGTPSPVGPGTGF